MTLMEVVPTGRHQKWIEKSRLTPYLTTCIRLPSSLTKRALKIQDELRAVDSRHIYSSESYLHITVKEFGFLGEDVKVKSFSKVLETVGSVASNHSPFDIGIEGVGVFPTAIFSEVKRGASEVRKLNQELVKELGGLVARSKYDGENMKPHVTLLHFATGDVEPILKKATSLATRSIGKMTAHEIQVV